MQSSIIPLSEELRAAHRGASYHAATPRAMPLKVDVHSTDLAQLLRKRMVQTAALLTAYNPASKKQSPAKNKRANAALQARIEELKLGWLPGHRKAFKEGDLVDEGFLVFGITGGQLEALMVEFDQEVALWCPFSGTPVLMLHPLARRNYTAADLAWEKAMKEAGKSAFVRPSTKNTSPAPAGTPAPKARAKAAKTTKTVVVVPEPTAEPAAAVVKVVPAAAPVSTPTKPTRPPKAKPRAAAPVVSPVVVAPVVAPAPTTEKPVRKSRVAKPVVVEPALKLPVEPAVVAVEPAPRRKTRQAKTLVEPALAPEAPPAEPAPVAPTKPPRKPKTATVATVATRVATPDPVPEVIPTQAAEISPVRRKKSAKV